MRIRGVLVVVTALAACGGGGSNADGNAGGTGGGGGGGGTGTDADNCEAESSLTVSGAFTGTRSAPAAAASHGTANDVSLVVVSAQFGTPFLASWSFTFMGEPRLAWYTEAGPGCAASVADSADPTRNWLTSKGVPGTPDQGICTLVLTSVTPTIVLAAQTQYCVHGTMVATLPPAPGSTATFAVTLSASF
jgi:hypothetical protein